MKHTIVRLFVVTMFCIGVNGLQAQTVKDCDGNVYKTVKIGTQVWMAENLKTTKYKDGTAIPLVTDDKAWATLTRPAYCWYNNNIVNKGTYGALYNWYTINTNKLCPFSWHVPSDVEWTTLTTFLGGEDAAGGKLKETGTIHWKSPNTGATNETGFTALPNGYRYESGSFFSIGNYGNWWSSSEFYTGSAYYRLMDYSNGIVSSNGESNRYGYSVRCLKDK
jgi:uncharacterized protein (TIGR02145 family)